MVPAREVRAPDRAFEKDVADLGELVLCVEEDQVARGMAGAMQDIEGLLANSTVCSRVSRCA